MADAKVAGPGVDEMKLLAAKLREADPALKKNLRKRFRDAAEPVVGDVEQSILLMPSHHNGTLRREIIRTIKLSTSFSASGVRVQIDSSGQKMPPGKETLPRHTDSARGWHHPVYGHGPRSRWHWVKRRQLGKPGWFEGPITDNAREFRDAALKAIDAVERELGAS